MIVGLLYYSINSSKLSLYEGQVASPETPLFRGAGRALGDILIGPVLVRLNLDVARMYIYAETGVCCSCFSSPAQHFVKALSPTPGVVP